MSSAALVTLEEYLTRSEKPLCEYRDGVLYPKPMPSKLHALVEFLLITMLRQQGVEALSEVAVRLAERRFLIPDVIAASEIQSPYPTEPVLSCCEVLSSGDLVGAMLAKCEEYHAWGVPHCWVIDPVKRSAWQYDAGGEPERLAPDGTLRAGELRVSLAELYSALPE